MVRQSCHEKKKKKWTLYLTYFISYKLSQSISPLLSSESTKVYAPNSYGEIEDQELATNISLYLNKKEGLVYQTSETIITPVTSPEFWTGIFTIDTKIGIALEASFTSSPLHLLPWNFPKHIQTELRSHPLIGPTTSSTPGPLTSLRLNPDSPLECTAIS